MPKDVQKPCYQTAVSTPTDAQPHPRPEGSAPSWAPAALRAADRARFDEHMQRRFGHVPRWPLLVPAWLAVRLHRAAHAAWTGGARWRGRLLVQLNAVLTGADIHPHCRIGPGWRIEHPVALTASGWAGAGFTMAPLSGIGMLPRADDVGAGAGLPWLGDGVWLGAGAGVLGPVRIGDGSRIEAGSAVTSSMPAGATARPAGAPRSARPVAQALPLATEDAAPPSLPWRQLLRSDIDRYLAERLPGVPASAHRPLRRLGALLTNEVMVVALHRLAHAAWQAGHRRSAATLAAVVRAVFKASLDPASAIGGGWFLPHPTGAVVQGRAGTGLTMYARSVLLADGAARPWLGDGIVVAGMAGALGPARAGDGVRIGFNMHLAGPAPAGATVAGPMMRARIEPALAPPSVHSPSPVQRAPDDPRRHLRDDLAALSRACGGRRGPLTARLALRLFRASQWAWQQGRNVRARRLWQLNVWLSGADLDPRSRIGPGFALPYPAGVSLHVDAGRGLHVGPLVVAGPAHAADPDGLGPRPQLGDGVELALHAKVCGPWQLGDGARVGPGVAVDRDVPAGHHLELAPPRLLRGDAAPQD